MIFHLIAIHPFAEGLVMCFESDGTIALESLADIDKCCNQTSEYITSNDKQYKTCTYCEDVVVAEDCDEYYSSVNNNLKLSKVSDLSNSNTYHFCDQQKIYFTTKDENSISHHLKSHKTVLLLI